MKRTFNTLFFTIKLYKIILNKTCVFIHKKSIIFCEKLRLKKYHYLLKQYIVCDRIILTRYSVLCLYI